MRNPIMLLGMLLLSAVCVRADILALKNGQTLEIPGAFEIKGKYVQYYSEDGDLLQLPLKLVDVELSRQLTQERIAELEAEKLAAEVEPEPKKPKTIRDVAAEIEGGRSEDAPAPSNVEITSSEVSDYGRENPRSDNTAQQGGNIQGRSASEYQSDVAAYNSAYGEAVSDVEKIDRDIQDTQEMIKGFENQMLYGDDPTSSTYDAMEKAEERLKQLQAEKQSKEAELNRIRREAKSAGVNNVRRNNPRETIDTRGEDDLSAVESVDPEDLTYDPDKDPANQGDQ